MNEQQLKDTQKCEEIASQGKDMDCFECSCNVCVAQMPDEVETYKRQLLENLEILKEDIPYACSSIEEMFSASEMLKHVINLIEY